MKITKIILENFRGFYGKHEIILENFNVFIGKNDQGKSSILEAIDIFINEGKGSVKIDQSDLNIKAKEEGIQKFKISLEFSDYPDDITIDVTNSTSLKKEYLLNENGRLEILKVFKNGKVEDIYLKCYHPANDEFIKNIMHKKIVELKKFVEENNIEVEDRRKSANLRESIRRFYASKEKLARKNIDLPINAEGIKDIWSQLKKYLPVYALFHSDRKNVDQDNEMQDPLKVKVEQIFKKDKIQKALEKIGNEVNNEIKEIANSIATKFQELSSISASISPNIPEVSSLKWKDVYKGIGFNTEGDISLNKRGSGFRRIVLLSSFLAEADRKIEENENSYIVYAIEEPETSLHPDLQLKLINALLKLSERPFYQILITTHSPAMIRLFETKHIKYLEKDNGISKVYTFSDDIKDKIISTMGLLPSISKVVICVEGKTDEMFLLNVNQNINELKQIINLNKKIEDKIISIIPMNGSRLKDWIGRYVLENTNVLEYHLYDRDLDEKYKNEVEKVNARKDGSRAKLTQKREIENYVPKNIIEKEFDITLSVKDTEWDDLDITKEVHKYRKDLKESDIKSIICGKCSKQITKNDLLQLNAWKEVKTWFEEIKELTDKALV